jgi:hypothetical protein
VLDRGYALVDDNCVNIDHCVTPVPPLRSCMHDFQGMFLVHKAELPKHALLDALVLCKCSDAPHEQSIDVHVRFPVARARGTKPLYACPSEGDGEGRALLGRLAVRAADEARGVGVRPGALVVHERGGRVIASSTVGDVVGCEWGGMFCPWRGVTIPRRLVCGIISKALS